MPCEKLIEYLDDEGVAYEMIEHTGAYTAQEIADRAHVSGKQFAKTVMVVLDDKLAMAVLPADRRLNLTLLQQVAGAETVRLASEADFEPRFPDCELGAMPPFGNLYGLAVYVAASLADAQQIAFNAGTHTELIQLAYADFERLVQPRRAQFTYHVPRERRGET